VPDIIGIFGGFAEGVVITCDTAVSMAKEPQTLKDRTA